MHPEYLHNNDTQEICRRVQALAANDEPALRAYCREVSRQTDTSSLVAKEECISKARDITAVFEKTAEIFKGFSQSVTVGGGIFDTQNAKADFGTVCQAITKIEQIRQELLSLIAELTQARQALFAAVANTNRALHFLKTAKCAVPSELCAPYNDAIEHTEAAYARLVGTDTAVREVQIFSMMFIERHLPAFMERLRAAADFNHAGAALNKATIRALCTEALIVINRAQNIIF